MTSAPQQPRLERALFYANSAFIFWAFAFIVTGPNYSSALGALLLAALFTLPMVLPNWGRLDRGSRFWFFALLAFGLMEVLMTLVHFGEISDLERPLKYVGAALVFLYLTRFGFSRIVVILGIAIGTVLGLAHGGYDLIASGLPRASAGHNPLTYGYLMVALGLLLIFFSSRDKIGGWRWPLAILGVFGCLGALLSGSKGVVLVVFAAMIVGGVHWIHRTCFHKSLSKYRAGLALLVIIVIAVAGVAVTPVGDRVAEEWHALSKDEVSESSSIRLALWNTGLHVGAAHPLTGAGIHKEQLAAESRDFIEARNYPVHLLDTFSHFHNEYIDAWAKKGLPGLLALIALGVGLIWGSSPGTRAGLILFVTVYAVGGLSQSLLAHGHGIGMLLIGALILRTLSFQETSGHGR
ncbi:MAG: O-antigen ligase family protein [Thioalkalivibrio sp.]|nr:O-antigen ligase family protein [Thioalkalivibrio sp.]